MKIISFSAVEILPKLLNKTKTQTIRRKRRIEQGEEVSLIWHQRSKYKMFCRRCGRRILKELGECEFCGDCGMFSKYLGTAEITEVFGIILGKNSISVENLKHKWRFFNFDSEKGLLSSRIMKDLAERDGFENSFELFKWLDINHGLDKPQKFTVYRFKWL